MSDDTIGGGQLSFVNVTRAEKRGNPINSQEKKDFFLVSPAKKGSEPWQKGTKKLGRFLGWFFASKEMFG